MSDEELITSIMDIDVLLYELESALQTNNNLTAKRKLKQARDIIAGLDQDDDQGYDLLNKSK